MEESSTKEQTSPDQDKPEDQSETQTTDNADTQTAGDTEGANLNSQNDQNEQNYVPRAQARLMESSMAPVLAEYGLKRNKRPQNRSQSKSKPNRGQDKKKLKDPAVRQGKYGDEEKRDRNKKKPVTFEDNDDDKNQAKRERNMKVFNDIQLLRDCYYKLYMTKLRDKVDKQREDIRKKSEATENKIRAKEEQERRESHQVKKRLNRHQLDHDDGFIRRVPKSDHYKIIALQNKLTAEGMLRTQEEKDTFWREVRDPNMLRKYLSVYKPLPSDPSVTSVTSTKKPASIDAANHPETSHTRSRTSSQSSVSPSEKAPNTQTHPEKNVLPDFRPMTQIDETKEPSRPVTRDPVGEIPVQKPDKVVPKKRETDPYVVARMAAAELDSRYPQMELPPMSCFTMELGDKPPDPDKILEEVNADRRQKERKLFIKRLRRMYHLSRSNGASAQRILGGHEEDELTVQLQNPNVGDIIAIEELSETIDQALGLVPVPRPPPVDPRPWTKHLPSRRPHSIQPIMEETGSYRITSASSAGSRLSRASTGKKREKQEDLSSHVMPLSLSVLSGETSKVMEAKCMSTYWTNYLNVGTSKFAPTVES